MPFLSRNEHAESTLRMVGDWALKNVSMNVRYGLDVVQKRVASNDLGLIIDKARSMVGQKYMGDINMIPPRQPLNALKVLSNATLEDVRTFIRRGEKATWPKVDMVANTTAISRTFRDCRARLDRIEERMLDQVPMTAV